MSWTMSARGLGLLVVSCCHEVYWVQEKTVASKLDSGYTEIAARRDRAGTPRLEAMRCNGNVIWVLEQQPNHVRLHDVYVGGRRSTRTAA